MSPLDYKPHTPDNYPSALVYSIKEIEDQNKDEVFSFPDNYWGEFSKKYLTETSSSKTINCDEQNMIMTNQDLSFENPIPVKSNINMIEITNKLGHILSLGESWSDENIPGPTEQVINYTSYLLQNNLIPYKFIPYRITPTIEEGLCLIFKNNSKTLYLEIYNDGEIGYIIEDFKNKKVLKNEEVFSYDDIVKALKDFYLS